MVADQNILDDEAVDNVSSSIGAVFFKSWHDQYQLIHHLILYSNILMVIQGRKQSGKSTYLAGLASKLPSEFSCHIVQAAQVQNVEVLNANICQLFSLNDISLQENISTPMLMAKLQTMQKHCLLMIDDAHLLCEEVLTTIMAYIQSQDKDTYFHCLLMGDLLLSAKFSEPAFAGTRETMTHFIDMPELDVQDAKVLLERKFSSLGHAYISLMSDDNIHHLLKQANGNLNVLCELAQQTLKSGHLTKKRSFIEKLRLQKKAKVVGATVAGVIGFVLVLSLKSPVITQKNIQQLALPQEKKLLLNTEQAHQDLIHEGQASFELRPQLASTIELTKTAPKKANNSYVPMSIIPNYKLLASKVVKNQQGGGIEVAKGSRKYKSEDLANTTIGFGNKVAVSSEIKTNSSSTLASAVAEKKQPMIISKPTVKNNPDAARQQVSHQSERSVKGYGIQLSASTDLQALKRMAREHHVYGQARYYEMTRKGSQWYLLVLGHYETKEEALKAKGALPQSLQLQKPWPRSTEALKEVK